MSKYRSERIVKKFVLHLIFSVSLLSFGTILGFVTLNLIESIWEVIFLCFTLLIGIVFLYASHKIHSGLIQSELPEIQEGENSLQLTAYEIFLQADELKNTTKAVNKLIFVASSFLSFFGVIYVLIFFTDDSDPIFIITGIFFLLLYGGFQKSYFRMRLKILQLDLLVKPLVKQLETLNPEIVNST